MANEITRTLTIHTYTFGTINPSTMTIENMETITSPVKIGPRKLQAMQAEKGVTLLTTKEEEILWAISLEDFWTFGHKFVKKTKEDGSQGEACKPAQP